MPIRGFEHTRECTPVICLQYIKYGEAEPRHTAMYWGEFETFYLEHRMPYTRAVEQVIILILKLNTEEKEQ
jgi:hypothetical protein